jgi:uncharacterized protein YcbK (DUF882 family)
MGFGAKRATCLGYGGYDGYVGRLAPLAVALMALVPLVAASSGDVLSATPRTIGEVRVCIETPLAAAIRPMRVAAWAEKLRPVEVEGAATTAVSPIRLYGSDGEIDPDALSTFARMASRDDDDVHPLAARLVQLVFKAAYHFGGARVVVVSGFRPNAGKHGTSEALDFKLKGVRASRLAGYLRGMPRAGVGIYTHPRTQYVHLDVRDPSFHWIDASPPGVHWHEGAMWDKGAAKRDASWTPEMDLP